jgi:N-acetylglucosaminyldiphosphoundecaprenol N-acetyl-beta-D-mannosaminyltransferase
MPERTPTAARATRESIFGLKISPWTAAQVASRILAAPRPVEAGVGLVVTANMQHIALRRTDPAFREAYGNAEIVTCDGFSVHYYARLRGCFTPGRVTGCDIVIDVMADPAIPAGQRFYFVVDHTKTAVAIEAWSAERGMADRIAITIPPFGFERDVAYCQGLAAGIRAHGTTLLFMGVGAPKSEVFVHRYRDSLSPCWALCIGQAVKIALGLTRRAPKLVRTLNLEWLWRTIQEPGRIGRRSAQSIGGFVMAIIEDMRHEPGAGAPTVQP